MFLTFFYTLYVRYYYQEDVQNNLKIKFVKTAALNRTKIS